MSDMEVFPVDYSARFDVRASVTRTKEAAWQLFIASRSRGGAALSAFCLSCALVSADLGSAIAVANSRRHSMLNVG